MTLSLSQDWYELLASLTDSGVRFLLVGAHALAAHAEPRVTKDLDVLVEPTRANGARLRDALTRFGLGAIAPTAEELARPGPFWIYGRPPVQIDVLTQLKGVSWARAWKGRVAVPLDAERTAMVIGRAELIASKRAAGQLRDLADLASLEAFAADERAAREPAPRPRARKKPARKPSSSSPSRKGRTRG